VSAGRTVVVWTGVTGCGTRTETLTDDGHVHVDVIPRSAKRSSPATMTWPC
jgi:hypothetical protein